MMSHMEHGYALTEDDQTALTLLEGAERLYEQYLAVSDVGRVSEMYGNEWVSDAPVVAPAPAPLTYAFRVFG